MLNKNQQINFLNFTDVPEDEAKELVQRLAQIVTQAETDRESDVTRAHQAVKIYRNELWSDKDKEFFEQFDMAPYQIPEGRAPINRLINQQRETRYKLQVTPLDEFSYDRHKKHREQFVQENIDTFNTADQAGRWFDMYADDQMALAVSAYYDNVRVKNKTKYIESEVFENGVITGCDFFKTYYTNKDNPDGQIKTERRSVRQMFWDRTSVDMNLDDVEYIGEVHRLYKDELMNKFPDHSEEIAERFESYTRMKDSGYSTVKDRRWEDFYKFDIDRDLHRLKVAEIWFRESEERFQLEDQQTGDLRLIKYGLDEEQIWNELYEIELDRFTEAVERGEESPEIFRQGEEHAKQVIINQTHEKYTLRTTQAPVWVKVVFSHNGLFEYKRNPLPHESHPYTPFFAQFIDGWYSGIIDDIRDLMIALNKAVMFRELMMAHGAKGLLIIDRNAIHQSDYSVDDIREMWTQLGGIIDLELKGGRRLGDIFQQVTTIGEGFGEITRVIGELEQKIYRILGVNEAMLGMVGNEAPASQVRQRIQQGIGTNGILFDNFNRALETHVHHKIIPLIITDMIEKRPKAMRILSENRTKWIEFTYDDDFQLFVDSIRSNNYVTKLEAVQDAQMNQSDRAMLMQLAAQSPDIDVEAAIEFSGINNAHEFLRRSRELVAQKKRQMVADQVDLQQVQQMLLEQGIDQDQANKIISNLKLQRMNELQAQQNAQTQSAQGIGEVQRQAGEDNRIETIEQQAMN